MLTGCGGDDTESASSDTTPAASASASESVSSSATPDETESTTSGDISDFPTVDGFTYADLPGASFKQLTASLKGTPQLEGADAKFVEKDGQQVGLVMQIAIDPEAASAAGFEEGFLPGFAGGVAGSDAAPDYEDINGTKVVTIGTPGEAGTAYAWLEDSIATVLVFKDAADAEAFAQAALA
jgi:hypothetical protein